MVHWVQVNNEKLPSGDPHQPKEQHDAPAHVEASSDVSELDVPVDLSDPRWRHFHPDVQGEFVAQDVGDTTINDEVNLRLAYGSDVFLGDQAPLAEDLLELGSISLANDPALETDYLHASLLGREDLMRRLEDARRSGDDDAMDAAEEDLWLVDPERLFRVFRWVMDEPDPESPRNSLGHTAEPDEDEGTPEALPPVTVPRSSY